jgi:DNA-binding beta-propeller fold protein YncE
VRVDCVSPGHGALSAPLVSAVARVVGLWLVALCVMALVPVGARAFSSSAYVINVGTNGMGGTAGTVSQFDIGSSGALSAKTPPFVAAGTSPVAVAVSPDAKNVYVADEGFFGSLAGGVLQYTVGLGGALTAKTPPSLAAENQPVAIAVSPDGKSVYVANDNSGPDQGVSQYHVGPDGALTPMANPTVVTGFTPDAIAVSPDDKSAYVVNFFSDGVSQYTVGPGGGLLPMATPIVRAGNDPVAIAVSPDGKSVYVVNSGTGGPNGVSQYDVGPGGALTPKTPATVAAGAGPRGIAVSPDGNSAYVVSQNTGVSQYDVGPGGALTPKTPPIVAAGNNPSEIAVSPDGKSAYVTNEAGSGAGGVSQYDVGPSGALSPKTPAIVGTGETPTGIAVSPDPGPVAAFSATPAPPGAPTLFNASASSDSDGAITSYAWNFGDGTSLTTTSPTVKHVYAHVGSYNATLTVTDDAGCSTQIVFTGQTAYCNGGPRAQANRALTIAALPSAQISSPVSGASYTPGQIVLAKYVCHEGTDGPGISSCAGPVANGQPIDTSTVGQHSFTVTATSKDGQTSTSTVAYTVVLPNNRFIVSHIKTHRDGTITFRVRVPGPGSIDVLETAWNDNLAVAAVVLQPAPGRFVVARLHRTAPQSATFRLRATPNARGTRLVHHHTYRVTLRLWVSYTPTGGTYSKQGFYGLHLPR